MSHAEEILIGVDGTAPSARAMSWALAEAQRRSWGLRVLCCYSVPSFSAASLDGGFATLDDSAIRDSAQGVLDEALVQAGQAGVSARGSLEVGDAVGTLIGASQEAGLAVVGTRGSGGIADRLLGTVSTALPAHAHCPVVVVPGGPAEVDRFIPPRRMVVGVDGSASSRVALEHAMGQAALWDAELTVVAAVPMAQGTGMLPWLPAAVDRGQVLADVEAALKVRVDEVAIAGVEPKVHALDGSGAALLTEFSSVVDLVIVGSRGRGGFAGMLLGSTSQSVLHHASCPVMVVPARLEEDDEFSPFHPPWQRDNS